jgi:VIT1/CCC1 family predicted Fe2+/Mn2+ transporter
MAAERDPAATGRPATGGTDEHDRSANLFDLRYLIGGLFSLYGVILVVASFFVGTEKSEGIDINLWLGLAMLALGVFFLAWARLRPLHLEGRSALAQAEADTDGRPGMH